MKLTQSFLIESVPDINHTLINRNKLLTKSLLTKSIDKLYW